MDGGRSMRAVKDSLAAPFKRGLAGCGKTIVARENFDGLPVYVRIRTCRHMWHDRRTLQQDAQEGRPRRS